MNKICLKQMLSAVLAAAMLMSGTASAYADDTTVETIDTPTSPIEIQQGDVDKDGDITSLDSLLVLRYSVGYTEDVAEDCLKYADLDNDNVITSYDALLILMKSINAELEVLSCPSELTVCCGDTLKINAELVSTSGSRPDDVILKPDNSISTDGSGEKVLAVTNTGRIKAFHPGVSKVTVIGSNGMSAVCMVTVEDNITTQTIKSGDSTLNVTKHMMLKNDCYNITNDFTKLDGIIVHSTATPGAMADIWYTAWNKPDTDAAVHAFLDDKGVYQYLPYEQTAWHAGQPANKTYLDFEICEPGTFYYGYGATMIGYDVYANQSYFDRIWKNATLYTAYLCKANGLTADSVISHAEAGAKGIGTNHGDPDHWFIKHGKTMNDFRADVKKILNSGDITITEPKITKPSYSSSADDFFATHPDVSPFNMFDVWGYDSLRY